MSKIYYEVVEDNNGLAENYDTQDVNNCDEYFTTNDIIERVRFKKPDNICVVLANRVEDIEFVNLFFAEL